MGPPTSRAIKSGSVKVTFLDILVTSFVNIHQIMNISPSIDINLSTFNILIPYVHAIVRNYVRQ